MVRVMAICPKCNENEISRNKVFLSLLIPSHFTVLMCNKCGALLNAEKGWFAELLSDLFLLFSGLVVVGIIIACIYLNISTAWGIIFILSWHAARSWLRSRSKLVVSS